MLTISVDQTVTASDQSLIFFDHYSRAHKQIVIIAHGFFNSKDSVLLKDLAHHLVQKMDVAVMDFRGHGKTPGLFYWTAKEYLDLEAVLRWARSHYAWVGGIGFSLGAATSIITQSKFNLMDSLICVSAPTSFEAIDYQFWKIDFENDILYNIIGNGKIGKGVRPGPFWLPKERPIDVVGRIQTPICFIHGDADWLIRAEHSELLFNQTLSFKKIYRIPHGPHAEYLLRKNRTEFLTAVDEWLSYPQTAQLPRNP